MLLQNSSVYAQFPVKLTSREAGRAMFGRGDRQNAYAGNGITNRTAAQPNGHRHPSAWTLPVKPGGGSSYTGNAGAGVGTATGAQGVTQPATATGLGDGTATGTAIAPGTASATGTGTGTGTALGVATGTASATGTGTGTAVSGSPGDGTATGTAIGTGTVTPGARGFGIAGPIPDGALDPDTIAAAVWAANAASSAGSGSMGQKLHSAEKAAKLASALSA